MLNDFSKETSYAELSIKAENRKECRTWKIRTALGLFLFFRQNTNDDVSQ